MVSKAILMVAGALCSLSAAHAREQGQVVWVDPSCDHFIAKVGDEFGTYNWRSGKGPSVGDTMEGELLNLEGGAREISNKTTGAANSVYVLAVGPRLHSMIHTAPVQCKERFRGAVK